MKIKEIQKKVLPVLKSRDVRRAGIFGSAAREESSPNDLDMLVELPRPYGLFTFLSLKSDLEDVLAMKVDLVDYANIKSAIRERILRDEVRIL